MAWFNLAKMLDERGWSMRTFADKLGVKPQKLSRYFKPGFDPNASTLLKWKDALGCKTIDEMLDDRLSADEKHMPHPKTARPFLGSMKQPGKRKGPSRKQR